MLAIYHDLWVCEGQGAGSWLSLSLHNTHYKSTPCAFNLFKKSNMRLQKLHLWLTAPKKGTFRWLILTMIANKLEMIYLLQVGHVLNMMHDDNPLCRQNFNFPEGSSYIMSQTMHRIDSNQPWSECSREAVIDFLQDNRGECLRDRPQKQKVGLLPSSKHFETSQYYDKYIGIGCL